MDNSQIQEKILDPHPPKPSPKATKRKTWDIRDLAQDLEQIKKDMKKN
jgi:hypothetical protein